MYKKLIPIFVVLAVAATVVAQTVVDPQTRPATAVADAPTGGAAQIDQAIATCLALGNQEEVALAQFAQDRLQSEEAKQFAEMMIQQHQAALEKLNRLVPQVAAVSLQGQPGAGADRPAAGQPGATPRSGQPGAATPTAGAPSGQHSTLTALQVRMAQECLNLTQRELEEKQGAEFDHCYIGQQVGAHIGMLAKLRGSREFASPQLQAFIQEAEQTVQQHLDHAKELAEKLMAEARDGGAGDQASRDPARR
jgi:predicted outer membrane protein